VKAIEYPFFSVTVVPDIVVVVVVVVVSYYHYSILSIHIGNNPGKDDPPDSYHTVAVAVVADSVADDLAAAVATSVIGRTF
jgi:hypothetical protein